MLLLLIDDTRELASHIESALGPYQAQIEYGDSVKTLDTPPGVTSLRNPLICAA